MNESQEQFCQRLMAADAATPEFRAKYEREMRMLFVEQKIQGKPKRVVIVQMTFSFLTATIAAAVAAFGSNSMVGHLARRLLIVSSGFLFLMALYCVRTLKREKVNVGTYNVPLENLGWLTNIAVFGILAFNSFSGSLGGLQLLGFGVGILVFGGVNKISQDVKRAELRTRTKLLQLEYQFADLTEKLQSRRD